MSEFRFHYRRVDALPRLAWCASMQQGSSRIEIEHGSWLETQDEFFVEGVWSGEFQSGNFDESIAVCGSGGRLRNGRVIFVTASHTFERLCSFTNGVRWLISNSLVYLLAALDDALDEAFSDYELNLRSVLKGLDVGIRYIPTRDGRRICLHYAEQIALDSTFKLERRPFPRPPSPSSFDDHVRQLRATAKAIVNNASAADRNPRYRSKTTISSGYDSPAVSVLASEAGCREALTVADARLTDNDRPPRESNDSGAEVAEMLGLHVHAIRRTDYQRLLGCPEAEFLATGNGGDDVVMAPFEPALEQTVLFTGFLGDALWTTDEKKSGHGVDFRTSVGSGAGASMGEFRLRVGFFHCPLPMFFAYQKADILAISCSREMQPWRVAGIYDRPVPRRIVEERGVARTTFGMEKRAVTQPFWINTALYPRFTSEGRQDLLRYAAQCGALRSPRMTGFVMTISAFTLKLVERLCVGPLENRAWRIRLMLHKQADGPLADKKLHWAVERILRRYMATEFRLPSDQASSSTPERVEAIVQASTDRDGKSQG